MKPEYARFKMNEDECQLRQTLTVEELMEFIRNKAACGESLIESTQLDQSTQPDQSTRPGQSLPTQQLSAQSQSQSVLTLTRIVQSYSFESIHSVITNIDGPTLTYSEEVQSRRVNSIPTLVSSDSITVNSQSESDSTFEDFSESNLSESVHSENEDEDITNQLQPETQVVQHSSPRTRTQIQASFSSMHQRAQFMFANGLVKLTDEPRGIYMVENEKKEVHMASFFNYLSISVVSFMIK